MSCTKCNAFTFRSKFPLFFSSLFQIKSSHFASNPNRDLEPWPYSISTLTCAKGVASTFKFEFLLFFCFLFLIRSFLCASNLNPNLDLKPCSISTLTCYRRCCSFPCSTCKHLKKTALGIKSSRKKCSSSSTCFGREYILVRDVI